MSGLVAPTSSTVFKPFMLFCGSPDTHKSTRHHQLAAMMPLPSTDAFVVNISVHFSITLWTSTPNILKMPARKDYKKALEQIYTAW